MDTRTVSEKYTKIGKFLIEQCEELRNLDGRRQDPRKRMRSSGRYLGKTIYKETKMARRKSDPEYCIDCGWRWPAPGGSRCPECNRKRMLMARRKREKQDVSKMTIEEVDKMAKERGISYGQMVILLEQGKV